MARPKGPTRAGPYLWGPQRLQAGLSIRELSELAGVNRGDLSKAENGITARIPAEAFQRIMGVLASNGVTSRWSVAADIYPPGLPPEGVSEG